MKQQNSRSSIRSMQSTSKATRNHFVAVRTPRRSLQRVVLPIFATIPPALALAGLGVASWYYSGVLLHVTRLELPYADLVTRVTSTSVTLQRTMTSASDGLYGLDWPGNGHAIVGPIIDADAHTVTRKLLNTNGPMTPGLHVRVNVNVYAGDPHSEFALPFTEVSVPTSLGAMPAWQLDGGLSTWVIVVHGYTGGRIDCLRALPPLTQMGFPVLDISYRNDVGAPSSPDSLYHLGDTEWHDLEDAVRYALAHGAKDVILYGWSLGGGIVQTFLNRSTYTAKVKAVVLDSPALNWRAILDNQAIQRHFPLFFVTIVKKLIEARLGMRFSTINHLDLAHDGQPPTLLIHGTDDQLVPIATSDTFARTHPDTVTYHRISGADHIQPWNLNPEAYDLLLTQFLLPYTYE